MIVLGELYFYTRSDGKIERGAARAYRINSGDVLVQMKSTKDGLFDWIRTSDAYETFGEASKAKNDKVKPTKRRKKGCFSWLRWW